jgi:hypothetical protein
MKLNANFNTQAPIMFIFFFILSKVVLLKIVHPLKVYQNTNFYGPTLTGACFASTSIV